MVLQIKTFGVSRVTADSFRKTIQWDDTESFCFFISFFPDATCEGVNDEVCRVVPISSAEWRNHIFMTERNGVEEWDKRMPERKTCWEF